MIKITHLDNLTSLYTQFNRTNTVIEGIGLLTGCYFSVDWVNDAFDGLLCLGIWSLTRPEIGSMTLLMDCSLGIWSLTRPEIGSMTLLMGCYFSGDWVDDAFDGLLYALIFGR